MSTLPDQQMQWFADKGFGDGTWNDRFVGYLRSLGLDGALDDMIVEASRQQLELPPGTWPTGR